MNNSLQYKDISLVPKYSQLSSRSEAKTSIRLGQKFFNTPVIPANMRAVINAPIAARLSDSNHMYIMHRFDLDIFNFVAQCNFDDWHNISISLGVKPEDAKIVEQIAQNNFFVDFITIDIAHGHSILATQMISIIKEYLPATTIIAGNVATPDGVYTLAEAGADMVKVGIGQGNVCTTKDKTGFTIPMFTCVKNCSDVIFNGNRVPIIADGGIRCNGDIAKAFVAGATMVMIGSMFSQCTDSAATSVVVDGRMYKQYFGSASEFNKGHENHIEGVMKEVPSNNMTYIEKLKEIRQDLQSAISYAGGSCIDDFRDVEYLIL